jgi:hypothetical protein
MEIAPGSSLARLLGAKWQLCLLLAGLCCAPFVFAQAIELAEVQLRPPVDGDGASGDNFGISVAASGDTVVVGAYGDTVVSTEATFGIAEGTVTVFARSGDDWVETQKIMPEPIGEDGDNFGLAVAMVDDLLAVGSPRRSVNGFAESGAVFIYGRTANGFLLRQLLTPPVVLGNQRYGSAVAQWLDFLAVGVPQAGSGRVDVYRRDAEHQYQFERSLFPPGGNGKDRFGAALALADNELLIGAPAAAGGGAVYRSSLATDSWSDPVRLPLSAAAGAELGSALAIDGGLALAGAPGVGAGEVRLLSVVTGWGQIGRLIRDAAVVGDRFGSAVVLDAEHAAVSAGTALNGEGAVTVFARSSNSFQALSELDIADGGTSNRFGASLALSGDGLLVGADLDRVGPNRSQGAVHYYRIDGVTLTAAARLDNGDGAMFDRFGTSVAIDGDTAMVGAYVEDTDAGPDAGRVHWYQRVAGAWHYGGALDAPDAATEQRFGISVDIDGDYAVVGAYWDVVGGNVDQGSAYIYRKQGNQWVFDAKVSASDGRRRDLFGFAVALSGNRLLVGARGAYVPFVEQGRAYIYVRGPDGWTEEAQLDLPTPAGFAYFGASVALVGDLALIGAPGVTDVPGPLNAGAAYVFMRQGDQWTLRASLQSPDPRSNSAFGFSVSADAQSLLIGAFQDGTAGQGAAYLYRAVDQGFDTRLGAAQAQVGEGMGAAVAISGDIVVLGAPGFDLGSDTSVGTAHVFERRDQTWIETRQWFAVDAVAGDSFGRSVAIDRATALIGAPAKGIDNPLEGMVYVKQIESVFANGFE